MSALFGVRCGPGRRLPEPARSSLEVELGSWRCKQRNERSGDEEGAERYRCVPAAQSDGSTNEVADCREQPSQQRACQQGCPSVPAECQAEQSGEFEVFSELTS